jgi:hypothetical protein
MENNIWFVREAVKKAEAKIDMGARLARDEMMAKLIQLAQEEIKGDRRDSPYPATPGEPPMNVTGNLRRSIRGEKFRTGFASYSAVVGPTMVYGRSLEVGGNYAPPSWAQDNRYPFMKPAFEKYRRFHYTIMRKHLSLKG